MRRIELLSENLSLRISTSIVCYCGLARFPYVKQADTLLRLVGCNTLTGHSRRLQAFTTQSTPLPEPWYSRARRAAALRQPLPVQNYRCRLILKRVPFKEFAQLYSLITLQDPRRNLYIPEWIVGAENYILRSFSVLSISRAAALFAISSRLSCSFLPLQSPSSSFTRLSLK